MREESRGVRGERGEQKSECERGREHVAEVREKMAVVERRRNDTRGKS